ncbi:MAG: SoxR reducing system RseC family protein [Planctomycetota bacterium]
MRERGIVRTISDGMAKVIVVPASPESCDSCGVCEDPSRNAEVTVEAVDGLYPGKRVWIEVPGDGELGPAVVVFLLPVLAILVGAILGAMLPGWFLGGTALESGTSTWFALLGVVLLLVPVLILIRIIDRGRSRRESGPRIVGIEG